MDAVALDDSATVMTLTDCPAEAQLRRVPKFETDPKTGEVLSSHLEDVPATYAWLLVADELRIWLSADDSPWAYMDAGEGDRGPVVGRLVGVNLPDGSLSYGSPDDPRHRCEVRQKQMERMIAAGLVSGAKDKE